MNNAQTNLCCIEPLFKPGRHTLPPLQSEGRKSYLMRAFNLQCSKISYCFLSPFTMRHNILVHGKICQAWGSQFLKESKRNSLYPLDGRIFNMLYTNGSGSRTAAWNYSLKRKMCVEHTNYLFGSNELLIRFLSHLNVSLQDHTTLEPRAVWKAEGWFHKAANDIDKEIVNSEYNMEAKKSIAPTPCGMGAFYSRQEIQANALIDYKVWIQYLIMGRIRRDSNIGGSYTVLGLGPAVGGLRAKLAPVGILVNVQRSPVMFH